MYWARGCACSAATTAATSSTCALVTPNTPHQAGASSGMGTPSRLAAKWIAPHATASAGKRTHSVLRRLSFAAPHAACMSGAGRSMTWQ